MAACFFAGRKKPLLEAGECAVFGVFQAVVFLEDEPVTQKVGGDQGIDQDDEKDLRPRFANGFVDLERDEDEIFANDKKSRPLQSQQESRALERVEDGKND